MHTVQLLRGGKKQPLLTCSELADLLGIPHSTLCILLRRENAPKPVIHANDRKAVTANRRVNLYEKFDVVKWYRQEIAK